MMKQQYDPCLFHQGGAKALSLQLRKSPIKARLNLQDQQGPKKGSNQPEPSTEHTSGAASTSKTVKAQAKTKTKRKNIAKYIAIKPLILDSPAMGTRSKICNPASPAMSTSKRRLSL